MYFTTDSTWPQVVISISYLFIGMIIGILFIFVTHIKGHIKKFFWKNFLDLVFCIAVFILITAALYVISYGKIQAYMVVSVSIGFLLSRFVFEKTVKNVINGLYRLFKLTNRRLIIKSK